MWEPARYDEFSSCHHFTDIYVGLDDVKYASTIPTDDNVNAVAGFVPCGEGAEGGASAIKYRLFEAAW